LGGGWYPSDFDIVFSLRAPLLAARFAMKSLIIQGDTDSAAVADQATIWTRDDLSKMAR
jgi:hypothetical protein